MIYKGTDIRHYIPHVDEVVEGFLARTCLLRLRGFSNPDIVAWDVERIVSREITLIPGIDLSQPADIVKRGKGTTTDIAILTATCLTMLNISGSRIMVCVCGDDACCTFLNERNIWVQLHKTTVMHPAHRQSYCDQELCLFRFNSEKIWEKA
jgi:hypothetical protein